MRKAVLISIAAVSTIGCSQGRAQDVGPTVQRSYNVGAFDRIEVAGPFDVKVITGGKAGVSASGPEKMIERLIVEVKGDRLVVRAKERQGIFHWDVGKRGTVKVQVSAPALSQAVLSGSGDVAIDKVSGDSFVGAVAGSGDLTVDSLTVKQVKLSIAGSGDLRARSGQAASAEYKIAGSGDIDAGGLSSSTAQVSIVGSGNIDAKATQSAIIKIVGSGDVTLTGGAKCTISKTGSGDAHCS